MKITINRRDVELAVLAINRMFPKDAFELEDGVLRLMTAAIKDLKKVGDCFEAYGVMLFAASAGEDDHIRVVFTIPCNEVVNCHEFREV